MLKQNSELRAEARVALTDKWVMGAVTISYLVLYRVLLLTFRLLELYWLHCL